MTLTPRTLRLLLLAALLSGCASTSPSPSPTPIPSAEPATTPSPVPTFTATPQPTPIPIDQALLARRFTVLVVGVDTSRARRAGGQRDYNTDALMVVSVSADKSRIAMMSLPRDTVDVPMADGTIYHHKINGIAQKVGIDALRRAVATLLGVPIDNYIRVDMDDFVSMVDAVGGIDIDVKTSLSDPKVHLHLAAGPTHLDGALALAFSRTRADSDYKRAARQQQVMLALARKWLNPGLATIVASVGLLGSLQTDIGVAELPTLLEIGRRSASAAVTAIVLQPPRFSLFVGYEPNRVRGWVMIPNVSEMRRYARSALSD